MIVHRFLFFFLPSLFLLFTPLFFLAFFNTFHRISFLNLHSTTYMFYTYREIQFSDLSMPLSVSFF